MISVSCETPVLNTSPSPPQHHKTPEKMPNHQPRLCSLSSPSIEASPHEQSKSICDTRIQPCEKYQPPFVSGVPLKLPPDILLVSSPGKMSFVNPVTNMQSETAVSQCSSLPRKLRGREPDLPNQRDAHLVSVRSHKACAPILNCVPCSIPVAPCRPSVSCYHLVPCNISGQFQPSFQFYSSPPNHKQPSAPHISSSKPFLPCRPCVPLCQPNITPCVPCKQSFELSEPPCNFSTPCGICLDTSTSCYRPFNPYSFPSVPCVPCFESFTPSCELVCYTPTQYSCNSRELPGCVPIYDQCIPCNVPYSRPCGMNGSCCVLNPENCSWRKNEPPYCCAGNFDNLPDLSPMPLASSVPSEEVNATK